MEAVQKEVEWLVSKASERVEFAHFKRNQGRVQQNAGVVSSWKFVASFSTDYCKQLSGFQVRGWDFLSELPSEHVPL
jgi:hypothetical protein